MSKLPLALRKNIKDAEETNAKSLEEINSLLGTSWTLEIDYAAFYNDIKDDAADYALRAGEVSTWYITELASGLKTFVKKDSLYKDALVEEVSANAIKAFKVVAPGTLESGRYNQILFEDGKLVIAIPRDRIAANIDHLTWNLEEAL